MGTDWLHHFLYLPQIQDYWLGAAVAIGFVIVGALRKSLPPETK